MVRRSVEIDRLLEILDRPRQILFRLARQPAPLVMSSALRLQLHELRRVGDRAVPLAEPRVRAVVGLAKGAPLTALRIKSGVSLEHRPRVVLPEPADELRRELPIARLLREPLLQSKALAVGARRRRRAARRRARIRRFIWADDYEKVGRPCDAIAPLELVAARRSGAPDIASFRQRIEMLYVLDECKPLRPTGKATIRFVPGQLATTKVVLNGKTSLQMVVDTGASYVTITRKTAERLGIDVAKLPKVQVATAAGVRTHSRGRLDEVKVQGLTAKNVDLTITDDLGGAEGLLGQSYLARFQITTDNTAGKLELTAR